MFKAKSYSLFFIKRLNVRNLLNSKYKKIVETVIIIRVTNKLAIFI